jgi:hypothetical protein
MSGVELATQLTVERPHLKVPLMSWFPNGMPVLNEGWHFLAKPFIPSQLCALILGLVFPEKGSKFARWREVGRGSRRAPWPSMGPDCLSFNHNQISHLGPLNWQYR